MTRPEIDDDYEDKIIESVAVEADGTYLITCDGWTLWCGKSCPVKPEVGQTARMYPRGVGRSIRGLFIDGTKVWYRTEAEEKDHSEVQLYGADARDWLSRWDRGDSCWSIEMGGLGPGYEQCIHITCAEVLRWFIEHDCDASKWAEPAGWAADREPMTAALLKLPIIKKLGLSRAQWGAAVHLATKLYRDGPRAIMTDDRVKGRRIQVQKHFPGSEAA